MENSKLVMKEGFNYSFDSDKCAECEGKCCNGESGNIWISNEEVVALAEYMNIPVNRLVKLYLKQIDGRWSLIELKINNNYSCVFYDDISDSCSIYDCRPKQCRDFPFWDYYKNRIDELKEECPAVIP
ncbi:MAG TPA: YkgJ family cysteine cluster protein [Victivallales bacterium]|nr:YkgJ family cysteine cluster protein [Victivallales bacterium]